MEALKEYQDELKDKEDQITQNEEEIDQLIMESSADSKMVKTTLNSFTNHCILHLIGH